MMMLPDNKKTATLIVAKMRPGQKDEIKEEIMPNEVQSDHSMALEDSAKKMMEALSKKDAKMFSSYLKDFIDMCDYKEDMSENESESEKE